MSLFNKSKIIATAFAALALVGCASPTTPKISAQERADLMEKKYAPLGIIYAQVNKAALGKDRRNCDDPNYEWSRQGKAAFCSRPVQTVFVALNVSNGKRHEIYEAVPAEVELKPGTIIQLDMTRSAGQHFMRVAALEETDTCRWEGLHNDALRNGVTKFASFTAEFFTAAIVPVVGLARLNYFDNAAGGVSCEGWFYIDGFKNVDLDKPLTQ